MVWYPSFSFPAFLFTTTAIRTEKDQDKRNPRQDKTETRQKQDNTKTRQHTQKKSKSRHYTDMVAAVS
jgi:hypothetical protein